MQHRMQQLCAPSLRRCAALTAASLERGTGPSSGCSPAASSAGRPTWLRLLGLSSKRAVGVCAGPSRPHLGAPAAGQAPPALAGPLAAGACLGMHCLARCIPDQSMASQAVSLSCPIITSSQKMCRVRHTFLVDRARGAWCAHVARRASAVCSRVMAEACAGLALHSKCWGGPGAQRSGTSSHSSALPIPRAYAGCLLFPGPVSAAAGQLVPAQISLAHRRP